MRTSTYDWHWDWLFKGQKGQREGEQGDKGTREQEKQGGIIEQVSPLFPPSSLSPLSLLHAQCPMPNAPCPITVGQWEYK
ncbi:hypothetical protein N0Y54_19735 [Nostoc punctiforme UO1]|uniref:hypothetical protein n=1 Tax=Nostoc punctiforme TaxID=272131 RepID=UPI0030A8E823